MLEITFGPKLSAEFDDKNPNLLFHVGARGSIVFKPTPRKAISSTKGSKGYYFSETRRIDGRIVISLDGKSADIIRSTLQDINNLVIQTGSEGRGNWDITRGNNIFTNLVESLKITQNTEDKPDAIVVRKPREVTRVVDLDKIQETNLVDVSLLYGTLWCNNPKLSFSGFHNIFIIVQKTGNKTKYIGFHPNHFNVFELDSYDISGNKFKEKTPDASYFLPKLIEKYKKVNILGDSQVINAVLKMLSLQRENTFHLKTEELNISPNATENVADLMETMES